MYPTWQTDLNQLNDRGHSILSLGAATLWAMLERQPLGGAPHVNSELIAILLGADDSDLVSRHVDLPGGVQVILCFLASLTQPSVVNNDIIDKLSAQRPLGTVGDVRVVPTFGSAVEKILAGDVLLFAPGVPGAFSLAAQGTEHRAIEKPLSETTILGPKESFNESLSTNISQIRRRVRDPRLRFETVTKGALSRTEIRLCYIAGLCNDALVNEARRRLREYRPAGVASAEYLTEALMDDPYTLLPTADITERPDVVALALIEGRFGILVDGASSALILPVSFWCFLQAPDDYYQNYIASSFLRILRYGFLFIALLMPALYIAVTTYHAQMLPTALLISVARSRQNIPFPAVVEAFIMELTFEILREAGLHLPQKLSTSLSVVGALVIGQAAVLAGLVSWPVVVIVSITAITNFAIPRWPLALSVRILRFMEMIAAAVFGLPGVLAMTALILTHMLSLRSFGIPYLFPVAPFDAQGLKDVAVRFPHWAPTPRPRLLAPHWRWRGPVSKPHNSLRVPKAGSA